MSLVVSVLHYHCLHHKEVSCEISYCQVEKVVEKLHQRNVPIGSAGQSATYVRSLKEESVSEGEIVLIPCPLYKYICYLPFYLSPLECRYQFNCPVLFALECCTGLKE